MRTVFRSRVSAPQSQNIGNNYVMDQKFTGIFYFGALSDGVCCCGGLQKHTHLHSHTRTPSELASSRPRTMSGRRTSKEVTAVDARRLGRTPTSTNFRTEDFNETPMNLRLSYNGTTQVRQLSAIATNSPLSTSPIAS